MDEYFEYLDELRESGIVKMFRYTAYLQEKFNLGLEEAGKILGEWMETFDERHSEQKGD